MWFAEYCGYEGLVDVRRALNVIREAGRIRNDFIVGSASAGSNIVNRHFAQFTPSLARAMEMQQSRYKMILEKLRRFLRIEIEIYEIWNLV